MKPLFLFSSLLILPLAFFFIFKSSSFSQSDPKTIATQLLQKAAITVNGNHSWDMIIHNENTYSRVLNNGSMGLGESYMDGWWDAQALDQFFFKLLRADLSTKISYNLNFFVSFLRAKLINLQALSRAFEVGEHHYDLSAELFRCMLGQCMIYSCGFWKNATNLEQAQEAKLELICTKLGLKPGMTVLDIGCGWGGFARFAAEKYGVTVTGITISKEQAAHAQKYCTGLPVTILLQDYRRVTGKFDRIVSVGMFEHVGAKNYNVFTRMLSNLLKDDGLVLLHTIGRNKTGTVSDQWINKYIFPNGMLPSIKQLGASLEDLFIVEDWHNFGSDYDKTLMAWFKNFDDHWNTLKSHYDNRFYRMWKYYLLSCAGLFRAREAQLWQLVLSKKGILGGYQPIR